MPGETTMRFTPTQKLVISFWVCILSTCYIVWFFFIGSFDMFGDGELHLNVFTISMFVDLFFLMPVSLIFCSYFVFKLFR